MANKAEFIRSLPLTMSANDVIEKAKEEGHSNVTSAYVYAIRSSMKKNKTAPTPTPRAPTPAVRTPIPDPHRVDHRRALTRAVVDLGFNEVEKLLGEVREKLTQA